MSAYILLISAIILICLFLNRISNKLGIPMLLAFIVLGMLFGSDGFVKIQFDNFSIAEQLCSVSLIFIMFYGGFGTSWKQAKPIAVKSILLSSLGVILTAALTGLFCFYILRFDLLESMLIGSVISSTDAASVFSILRSKRLNLKDNTASMLELESGSNDPCSYMLTVIVLSLMSGNFNGKNFIYMIFAQIVYGIAIGLITAVVSSFILKKFKFSTSGFEAIFVFGIALVSYAGASVIGGNGYLSTYIAGIILGNQPLKNKKTLVNFFDGITGLMQMLIFFLLGLLSFPSQLPKVALASLAIALFLTFIARPISIFAILSPFKCSFRQQLVVSWAGLRGAASIVFAIMATVGAPLLKNDIYHIVFFIVLFSISIQGTLLPLISKKLKMIDNNCNVMKTFSDYSDEMPLQFIKLRVPPTHNYVNKKIKDISLFPNLILAMILRGEEKIVPKGNTTIFADDVLVLSTLSFDDNVKVSLSEIIIEKDSAWLGMQISDIVLEAEKLIIAVKRKDNVIIPNGKTVLKENDILIINEA